MVLEHLLLKHNFGPKSHGSYRVSSIYREVTNCVGCMKRATLTSSRSRPMLHSCITMGAFFANSDSAQKMKAHPHPINQDISIIIVNT